LGRRDTVTGPDGFTQRYVYDNKGDVEKIRTRQYLADRFVGVDGDNLDPVKWDTTGAAAPTVEDGAASFTVADTPGSAGWMKSQGTLDSGYDTTYTLDLGDRTKATKVRGYNRYVTGDSWDAIEFTANSNTAKLKRKALWWNLTLGTVDIPATGKLRVRMHSGQQWLHVKIWADGDPEPENWDIGIQNQHPSWWGKPEWQVIGGTANTANTVTVDDVSIARLNGAETDLVTYEYNNDRQPTTETLPMGAVRTWGYVNGRIETMTQTGAGIDSTSSIGYDTSGRIDTETVNGELTSYGYDPAGQLTSVTPTNGPAESFTYTNLGQRHTQTTTAGVTTYNYNNAGELTSTTGVDNNSFSYDGAGRRLTETDPTGTTSYHYDPAGRHLGVTDPTATTLRALDPDGNPEQVVTTPTTGEPVETSRLHWDTTQTNPQLVALTNSTGTTNTLVRPNANHAWSAVTTGATTRPLATDIHHSTTADGPAANLATATTYDPFGQPAATPAPQPALGYRSETTIETLTHIRARQYQPTTSTFTTTDPLPGINGTTTLNNPYHYTNNNPLNHTDPSGMRTSDADLPDCTGLELRPVKPLCNAELPDQVSNLLKIALALYDEITPISIAGKCLTGDVWIGPAFSLSGCMAHDGDSLAGILTTVDGSGIALIGGGASVENIYSNASTVFDLEGTSLCFAANVPVWKIIAAGAQVCLSTTIDGDELRPFEFPEMPTVNELDQQLRDALNRLTGEILVAAGAGVGIGAGGGYYYSHTSIHGPVDYPQGLKPIVDAALGGVG
jgi:RHS repeat-associated protein